MQRAMQNLLSRVGRAPAFRPPQMRNMSGMPGKEQLNAAAARAGDEAASLGASLGENVQKLQWWTSAKVVPPKLALRYTKTGVFLRQTMMHSLLLARQYG